MGNRKETNPLQNLFVDIKKILSYIEIKDGEVADSYETDESRSYAEVWINANRNNDDYVTYKKWWTLAMFREVSPSMKITAFNYYMENPFKVPLAYRENLLLRGREVFFDEFEESNTYYRALMGLPPIDEKASDYIYLSEELKNKFNINENIPVHKLSDYIQNEYMNTEEYKEVLNNNPTKYYLQYLGNNKINLYTVRTAHDFEIIRYPSSRSDINQNLLNKFGKLYGDYREYVMMALYNDQLKDVYVGYRSFMRLLIMYFTLLQIANTAIESVNNHHYLDDTVIYTLFSMYGIPDDLILTKDIRRDFAVNIASLVKEKGTQEVYYDLIKILGYQDIVISKLVLMKGQQFDGNNNYTAMDIVNPYFIKIDLKDDNPYDTIVNNKASIYSYNEIIGSDPMWWDDEEVQKLIRETDYTLSDSKYITIDAVIHQMKYVFESIYFTRMILDNKNATENFMVEVPELFGSETVSLYDLILFIVCATCMVNNLTGEITTETENLIATAGFNFDIDINSFIEFVNNCKYVEKKRILKFISNFAMQDMTDVSRIYSDIIYPMREWLERKIVNTTIRKEYIEYEAIYKALYTYDITRNKLLDDFLMPIEVVRQNYNLTEEDMMAFKSFYPHSIEGRAFTVDEFNESTNLTRYHYPFLNYNNNVDWYIHIVIETPEGINDDRGYLYLYDILNSDDVRMLTNPDGSRIFMDYEDEEIGWQLNQQAVDKAVSLLMQIEEDDLKEAYFQVYTPVPNYGDFNAGEKLPASLRTGMFKYILRDKLLMDINGLCNPPRTYFECLARKNEKLNSILLSNDRFNTNREAWSNDIKTIILVIEKELNMHLKYFEQSALGDDVFFKPLITLINHFKSIMVDISKTGLKYIFDDKMDIGGNSNMLRLFDESSFIYHFITKMDDYGDRIGLYDGMAKTVHNIKLYDRSELIKMIIGEGFVAETRKSIMGSIRMVDEMKLFKNGKPIDDEPWLSGEPNTGRWSEEDDILMKIRKGNTRVQNSPYDMDGWKEFVEN